MKLIPAMILAFFAATSAVAAPVPPTDRAAIGAFPTRLYPPVTTLYGIRNCDTVEKGACPA